MERENLPKKGILIAYGELFLKSEGVRKLFQKRLINNLRFFLRKEEVDFSLIFSRERIFIETEQAKAALKIVKRVFGIAWVAESLFFPKINLKEFSDFISKNYPDWIKKNETFAIRLKLEKGILEENREKIINKIAEEINRKVDLDRPKREIFIEVRKGGWFLYFKKRRGAGGLPIGSSGKVLSLMSGGIDSPVSSFLSAKRGLESVWLHFHAFPVVSKSSIEKVKDLVKIHLKYQPRLQVYFIPFQKAHFEIRAKTPLSYRVLLYRRMMLRIAEKVALENKCGALVMGESLGQVSSQTLPNIGIVKSAVNIPILRPLIAYDKEEIIRIAKKIGSYDISIRPHEDCCSLFASKNQTAEGRIETVKELEKRLDSAKIIREIIKEIKVENY